MIRLAKLNKLYVRLKQYIKENLGFLLILVGMIVLFTVKLPYVIYTPGGTIDLSSRVIVEDAYEGEGSFSMSYVTMIKGAIPYLLLAKVLPNWDIEKNELLLNENETLNDLIEREKISLLEATNNAAINAYKLAGKHLEITKSINNIVYIAPSATTNLKIGDILISANGIEVNSLEEYKSIVESGKVGDIVDLTILRNKKEKACTIKIYDTEEGLKTGIALVTTYEYETDPKLSIKSKNSESGPSGGLMLALGIYNALVEEDITKGYKIVGTGTIESDGSVGAIGGVKYKLIGAVRNKADIFICPKDNYEEALKIKKAKNYKITIISASTFEDTVNELGKL